MNPAAIFPRFLAPVTLFAFLCCPAEAAEIPESNQEAAVKEETSMPTPESAGQSSSSLAEAQKDTPEQPTYPGVQNILYRSGEDNEPHAIIWYPAFGNEKVDAAIKYFVSSQGADFSMDVEASLPQDEEKPATYDQWEMSGTYSLSRPAPEIVSVTFNIYSYSGGAHGNLFIRCLNYDLRDGKALELDNIFGDPGKALAIMSAFCEKKLREDLGSEVDEDMLRGGTAPDTANFSNLSLRNDSIVVEFQPYQVGPWSIGSQSVSVPLKELADAKPSAAIWPDAIPMEQPETK